MPMLENSWYTMGGAGFLLVNEVKKLPEFIC